MVVLLLLLGVVAVAAGMFGLGLAAPVRETTFGAAVLVSSSITITGGFILVGLAAAVSELRRVLQAGMRQVRLPEHWEAERGQVAGGRRAEPRLGPVGPHGAKTGDVIPATFDTPESREWPHRQPASEEWPTADAGRARRSAAPSLHFPPASERPGIEPHATPAAAEWERFDTIRPSDYRKSDMEEPHEEPAEASPHAAGAREGEVTSPPLSPDETAASAAIRPVRVLKSGVINDLPYALFSDGSIETQTSDGPLRFASLDAFRKHLEKNAG